MKNILPPFAKLVAVAACALTLGSCSRAEYAMLPKSSSYHGVTRAATPAPAAAKTAAAPATAAATVTPASPAAAPAVAAAPAKATPAKAPAAATTPVAVPKSSAAAATVAAPAPKLNLVQRLAMAKVTKQLQKAVQKSGTARQHDNTAATQKLSGRLRQGIILVLVGVLIEIVAAANERLKKKRFYLVDISSVLSDMALKRNRRDLLIEEVRESVSKS